jgi:transcription elongation factor Elf1
MDERDMFTDRPETKSATFSCPKCKRQNAYDVRWVRRTKKPRLPGNADERDRALFAKLRDYLIRVDDVVTCKTCGRKFDIPSMQSLVFVEGASTGTPVDDDAIGNR